MIVHAWDSVNTRNFKRDWNKLLKAEKDEATQEDKGENDVVASDISSRGAF